MHLTNLFKSLIYSLTIALLIACLYLCSVSLFTGILSNYDKASWFYGYNHISTYADTPLTEWENQYKEVIGYSNHEILNNSYQDISLFHLKNEALDLKVGTPIINAQDIVISLEIANSLKQNLGVDSLEALIGQPFNQYTICGITNIEMESPLFAFVYYDANAIINEVIFSANTDMEKLPAIENFTLNNRDQVLTYVQKIMKSLNIGVVLTIVLLALILIMSKINHLNLKKTMLLNILGIGLGAIIIYSTNTPFNNWLSDYTYLHFPLQWANVILIALIIFIINNAIKRIKFFHYPS